METSEPILKLLKLKAVLALVVSLLYSGRLAFLVGDITRPSTTAILGPTVVVIFLQIAKSSSVM